MINKIHEIQGYIQTIYLVEQPNGLLLLDGCCRPDVAVVKQYIEEKLKRNFSDLELVISTHAHPDHVGGLAYFKSLGVNIAGPVGLNDWYKGFKGLFTYWVDIILTYMIAVNKKSGFKNIFFPRKVVLDLELKEGDLVPAFEDWVALECPGHTGIDLTLYNKKTNIAYVADNIVGSKKRVFSPYPISFPEEYKKSLKRYLELDIEDFLLAHYGKVKLSKEQIQKVVESVSVKSRRHRNSLHKILLKLVRSIFNK